MKFIIYCFLFLFSLGSFSQCEDFQMTISLYHPTCHNFTDGSITISVSGGTAPYLFFITDSMGTNVNSWTGTIYNFSAGTYNVFVSDSNDCLLIEKVELINPDKFEILYSANSLNCSYDDSGWVKIDTVLNYHGSFSNIGYYWNPNPAGIGGIGADSSYNMPGGEYDLIINDEIGCSEQFDIDILPFPINTSIFNFSPCDVGNDGTLYAEASGGNGPYTYLWENLDDMTYSNDSVWENQSGGNYALEITDANGCVWNDTITLSCLGFDDLEIGLEIYPNPTSGVFSIENSSSQILPVLIYEVNGKIIWSGQLVSGVNIIDPGPIASGIYLVRVGQKIEKLVIN